MIPFILLSWLAKSGSEEDSDLLLRIADRDEQAIEVLYDRYSKVLYSILVAILKSTEEAQDLLQEIFVQIWQKAPSFDISRGNVYSWMVALTRNRAIDRLRSKSFRERKQEHYDYDIDLIEASCFPTPLDAVLVTERETLVRDAFGQISPDQQIVLHLAYFEGHSQSEIADLLQIPLGTVKTRTRQAMIKLHQLLLGKLSR
ncbi:MAG: sigma-70 family RNA polymerase sigma factor [Ignavibacteriae bacterium]|nr:sigma-70 family RNA polymerase sigma factor [Ignavibacteriota bacterium]